MNPTVLKPKTLLKEMNGNVKDYLRKFFAYLSYY